jgi:predicted small lipoprotein YifL
MNFNIQTSKMQVLGLNALLALAGALSLTACGDEKDDVLPNPPVVAQPDHDTEYTFAS